jgi:hypothetical protein
LAKPFSATALLEALDRARARRAGPDSGRARDPKI